MQTHACTEARQGFRKDRYGYISGTGNLQDMSWMKGSKYSEKDKEKLEKGSGLVKMWTLLCNWFYRVVSW